jgi:hypothetical protein
MLNSGANVIKLVDSVHAYLNGLNDVHLQPFLANWPSEPFKTRAILPNLLPVISCMHAAIQATQAEVTFIVNEFKASAPHLQWGQTYIADDFGTEFLEKYGWAEIIGQRGPIASDHIACGLLLLASGTEYPPHRHATEEIYLPLTSPTYWKSGDKGWASRPIGVPIYHRSWLTHTIRAESVPLLALYLWRGENLVEKSQIN